MMPQVPPAPATLGGAELATYQTILQLQAWPRLEWREVLVLFRHLGSVEIRSNGDLEIVCNGHTLLLPMPRQSELANTEEQVALRHFLVQSAEEVSLPIGTPHWVLVIEEGRARVYRSPLSWEVPDPLRPAPPHHFRRPGTDAASVTGTIDPPDGETYFSPIAALMDEGGPILILDGADGDRSDLDAFVGWIRQHYPDVAGRLVGRVPVDASPLRENQLLEQAREFYDRPNSAWISRT